MGDREGDGFSEDPLISWRTGIAIFLAVIVFFASGAIYIFLFNFLIDAYSYYDSGFAAGVGAFIFLTVSPPILASLSGISVAKTVFPRSNSHGLFYAFSSLLVFMAILNVFILFIGNDDAWIGSAITGSVVVVASIFAVRLLFKQWGE